MTKKNRAAREAFARLGKERYTVTHNRVTACIDPDWTFEKRRMTADENMMTTWLVIMAQSMRDGMGKILRERLEMIPHGYARFVEATRQLYGIGDDLLCTMIPAQMVTMDSMCRRGQIRIELEGATATPNMTAVVRTNEMQTIARAAQAGECALCVKTGGEIRGCALRKAFDGCGLCEKQYDEGLGCIYRDRDIDLSALEIE